MMKNKTADFLHLSESEQQIIEVLKDSQGSLRPTEIAQRCSAKRTTVNYNLKKLKQRGIVSKTKVEGHYEWRLANTTVLETQINHLFQVFSETENQKKINIPTEAGVTASTGNQALKSAYEELLNLSEGQRVYTIEGNNLERQIKNFGEDYLIELQKQYRESGVILEGVIGGSTFESFQQLSSELLEHRINRPTVIYVVNDKFVEFDMHILIYEEKVKMINYEQQLVLKLENKYLKQTMLSLYKALKSLGSKVSVKKTVEKQLS